MEHKLKVVKDLLLKISGADQAHFIQQEFKVKDYKHLISRIRNIEDDLEYAEKILTEAMFSND